jgi:hypothetical protein
MNLTPIPYSRNQPLNFPSCLGGLHLHSRVQNSVVCLSCFYSVSPEEATN